CANLTHLYRYRMTNQILDSFCQRGREHLIHLNLSRCHRLTDALPDILSQNGCRFVRSLDIREVQLSLSALKSLIELVSERLEVLNLSKTKANNRTVAVALGRCPRLRVLGLRECDRVSSYCFKPFVTSMMIAGVVGGGGNSTQYQSNSFVLESLDLSYCSIDDTTGYDIAEIFPYLTTLDITGCDRVSKRTLNNLPTRLTRITSLKASEIDLDVRTANLDLDDVVCNLTSHFRDLQVFHLAGSANRLTDLGLTALSACADLTDLDVGSCTSITDFGIEMLASKCRKLKRVIVAKCDAITPKSLTALITECPDLEELDVSNNSSISDDFMVVLSGKAAALRKLSVRHCYGLTGSGVVCLGMKTGKPLDYLDLNHCVNICPEVVMELRRRFPKAAIRDMTRYAGAKKWVAGPAVATRRRLHLEDYVGLL
ncbi:hypothetical protein HK102_003534, partial [Quaeritorhiza haematococci]